MLSEQRKREIRARAEERAQAETEKDNTDNDRLIYELRVHQIELEMQNDELQRSERELERARERYRMLFDRAPVAYLILSPDGVIRDMNETAEQFLGASKRSLLEKPFVVLLDPSHHTVFFEHLRSVFRNGAQQSPVDLQIIPREGGPRWGRAESRPDEGTDDGERCLMAIADITERRRVEDDLRVAKEEAMAANSAKSTFLANMSHEIRTPLNGVLALTELVLDGELTDEQRSYLDKVYSSARSLLSIIDDVLDLSKIEAKKLSLNHHPLDLDDLLASVHDVFTQIAENKGIELTVHRDQSLPQRITGDVDRIRQILVNLVSNAVKFTEEGRVTLTARPEDGNPRVLFEVDDTGVGIDKADQERIFESFTQADGGFSRRYGGAGLGLSISRQLALRMGGTLTFESDVGRGSRFRLELPLQEASEAEESSEPPRRPSHHNADGGGRILVAEDNAINSLVLTKILEKAGFSVAKAGSGTEVLRHLASERFDAVLMDISMPGMDGITAARRIRAGEASEVNTDVPIVAITAHAMKGDRERFFEAGMDGYVAKPFTQDTVLESVHAALAAGEERA